jgi:hypothetical protein
MDNKFEYLPFRTNYLLKENDADVKPKLDQLTAETLSSDRIRSERVSNEIYY